MNQRTLPLCVYAVGLAGLCVSGACSTISSVPAADDEAEASPPPSETSAASTGDGGMPEGSPADATIDVARTEGGDEASSADVAVVDVQITQDAAADATTDADAGMEGGSPEAAVDAGIPEAGVPCVNLTILNYEVWCSVSVNGGDASVADAETLCVPPGTQQLAATAVEFFELGPAPWHDTAGDMGQGDPGTVTGSGPSAVDTTTVVVGATPKCIWVCCPFDDGVGCPTTDQCSDD